MLRSSSQTCAVMLSWTYTHLSLRSFTNNNNITTTPTQQQQYNLGTLRFNKRGAPTPLREVESCSLPGRWPDPIPTIPPYVVRHHISMEHRLRRKHQQSNRKSNTDTDAGNAIFERRKREKKQIENEGQISKSESGGHQKRENMKLKKLKNMKAGSPSDGPLLTPPLSFVRRSPKIELSQRKIIIVTTQKFRPIFVFFLTSEKMKHKKFDEEEN